MAHFKSRVSTGKGTRRNRFSNSPRRIGGALTRNKRARLAAQKRATAAAARRQQTPRTAPRKRTGTGAKYRVKRAGPRKLR